MSQKSKLTSVERFGDVVYYFCVGFLIALMLIILYNYMTEVAIVVGLVLACIVLGYIVVSVTKYLSKKMSLNI